MTRYVNAWLSVRERQPKRATYGQTVLGCVEVCPKGFDEFCHIGGTRAAENADQPDSNRCTLLGRMTPFSTYIVETLVTLLACGCLGRARARWRAALWSGAAARATRANWTATSRRSTCSLSGPGCRTRCFCLGASEAGLKKTRRARFDLGLKCRTRPKVSSARCSRCRA